MKKFLCLVMCLVLVMTAVSAFAAVEYTLEEKWQRQVDFGNGIKGTLNVHVEGERDWAQLLAPLSDVPLEIRAADDEFTVRRHFFGEDEELCLTHRATSRQIFVNGAVAAAGRLLGREPGFYTFDELMFD